jgi:hypothetical protein
MKIKLTKIWIEDFEGAQAVRADFSNDRHYRVAISQPGRPDQVAQALFSLADLIGSDPLLAPNSEVSGLRRPYGEGRA